MPPRSSEPSDLRLILLERPMKSSIDGRKREWRDQRTFRDTAEAISICKDEREFKNNLDEATRMCASPLTKKRMLVSAYQLGADLKATYINMSPVSIETSTSGAHLKRTRS